MAIPTSQAKIPGGNVIATSVPLVSPTEEERTSTSCYKGGTDLPVEHVGLMSFPLPATIQPDFSQQQRAVPCQILQPSQIRPKTIPGLEIHVEAHEVEKG